MKKKLILLLSITIAIVGIFIAAWIFFWTVIMDIPDDPYAIKYLNDTKYLVFMESPTKSWLCVEEDFQQYGYLIDDNHIRDVYWNDSVIFAVTVRGWVRKDSAFYIYSILDDSVLDGPISKQRFLQVVDSMDINISSLKHLIISNE